MDTAVAISYGAEIERRRAVHLGKGAHAMKMIISATGNAALFDVGFDIDPAQTLA